MSVKVSTLVWELRDCSPIQKLVLVKLADHASDDGRNIYPAQKSVAEDCGCDIRTVRRVVKWAVERGILVEVPSAGNRPNHYLFDMKAVGHTVRVTESQGDTQSGSRRTHSPARRTHSPARRTHSPTINKNHQLTIIQPSKEIPFSSDRFLEIWREWEQHRKEKKQTLTPTAKSRQLAMLAKESEDVAIAIIEQSLANGWTGLFSVKDNQTRKGGVDWAQAEREARAVLDA